MRKYMRRYHYYTDNSNEDLVYELPMYFAVGIEMSTTTFNLMFGVQTLGIPSRIKLERFDDEDVSQMKKYGLTPTRIPYPDILKDMIENNPSELRDDGFLVILEV